MQKTYAIALPPAALAVLAAAVLTACGGGDGGELNAKPGYLGTVRQQSYDGSSDDLLTAGMGKSGLAAATAPGFAIALQPTAAELRRLAIYTNYRAMLDMTAAGGYGTLYGPNVDAQGRVTAGEGRIAGTEYIAFSDDGTGRKNVTLMVQVPASFDPGRPASSPPRLRDRAACTAPSPRANGGSSAAARWPIPTRARAPRHMTS
jgi:hydroxybutyrate-dimer hydrolase